MGREPFNARAARAKRPCPLWVDAFQRDTQHLSADEVGAYMLILMAMWTRESCDLPDDDHRLARIARVSLRLWRDRVGPAIRAFMQADDGVVTQHRLLKEAAWVEAEVQKQSDRKRGAHAEPQGNNDASEKVAKKYDKPLKSNKTQPSTDNTTEQARTHPSQQPNNPTRVEEEGSSTPKEEEARAKPLIVRVMEAVGIDPSAPPKYWRGPAALQNLGIWLALGLTPEEVVTAAKNSRLEHPDPPDGPKALDRVMEACANQKRNEKPQRKRKAKPIPPPPTPDEQRAALERWAGLVSSGATWVSTHIRPSQARDMLEAGLTTPEALRKCGVSW